MTRKFIVAGVLLLLLLVFSSFVGGMFIGTVVEQRKFQHQAQAYPSVDKVAEVLDDIDRGYVESVSDEKLINGAINGMIQALGDPFTRYQEAKHYSDFKEEMSGHFFGVGIVISENKSPDDELMVERPLPDTPASRGGIKEKDIIAKIGAKPTKGMKIEDAVKLIRGEKGTKVSLSIKRNGVKDLIVVDLIRDQINNPNVFSKKLDNNIGYIQIYEFNAETGREVRKQYDQLKANGIKGLILDLRGNPGGFLDQAVELASLWIPDGPIVKTKSRMGIEKAQVALGGADTQMPLVVLINKGSASASEIVSGALQDYERAVIVGETSFGKASVQSVINLSDGSGLLLTTERYYTPKDRMIHKKGIKPDIEVKFSHKDKSDTQLDKAKEVMQEFFSGKRKVQFKPLSE